MGEARLLNLLNITACLISTCSHLHSFCLRLAPSILASCVYMQKQRQDMNKQAMEGKRRREHVKEA